ncbi:MAG TPA: arginine deiminase-related protein [Chitinophagaceae bacterium]
MIRPAAFGYNEETAVNNAFQNQPSVAHDTMQQQVLLEFDTMVNILRSHHINVIVVDDDINPPKPDAIFPNNWISTSPSGVVSLFPMFARNRRAEKREDIVQWLSANFVMSDLHDWSEFEAEGRFLEGTGSMVIDHDNKMIYASVSERTSVPVLEKFAAANGYQAIVFLATDKNGYPVYHTNVMMSLGDEFAILCEESLEEEWELIAVRQLLESTAKTIIPITREQMHAFAGNMLLVKNESNEKFLVCSDAALASLTNEQRVMLEAYAQLLPISIPTIERVEGGSVRCMMAEIFLKPKQL